MTLLPELHIGVQYMLATGLLVYLLARAYAHVITSRASRDRSRRDADLAEARYLDAQLSDMIDAAAGPDRHWSRRPGRSRRERGTRYDP